MRKHMYRVFMLSLAVLAAGCTTATGDNSYPCPDTGLVEKLDRAPVFAADGDTVAAVGEIVSFRGYCRPARAGGSELALELDFTARPVRTGIQDRTESFPYFVAVLKPGDNIMGRMQDAVRVQLINDGKPVTTKHNIHIPDTTAENIGTYKVAIGYLLTPSQRQALIPDVPVATPTSQGK